MIMTVSFYDEKYSYILETNHYIADTLEQLKKIDLNKEAEKRHTTIYKVEIKQEVTNDTGRNFVQYY